MIKRNRAGIVAAGMLLGIGLGGFMDGIVLHQILQWHNMLSSIVPPIDLFAMKYNMVWDGVFHAFSWVTTLVGVSVLWRVLNQPSTAPRSPWPTSILVGAFLLGWGGFNFLEGLIDHNLLGIHHVHPGIDQAAWDIGFLLLGIAMCVAGVLLVRRVPAANGGASH